MNEWMLCLLKFIYSFNKYWFGANSVSGTVLGNGQTTVSKTDETSAFVQFTFWWAETENKQDKSDS